MILVLQDFLHGEEDAVRTGDRAGGPMARGGVSGAETEFGGNAKVEAYLSAVPGPGAGVFDATVSIHIEDGWHIIGGKTDVPGLVPTALTFNADLPLRTAAVSYPPADTLRFGFSDVPVEVYQGEIRLTARIEMDSATPWGKTDRSRKTGDFTRLCTTRPVTTPSALRRRKRPCPSRSIRERLPGGPATTVASDGPAPADGAGWNSTRRGRWTGTRRRRRAGRESSCRIHPHWCTVTGRPDFHRIRHA